MGFSHFDWQIIKKDFIKRICNFFIYIIEIRWKTVYWDGRFSVNDVVEMELKNKLSMVANFWFNNIKEIIHYTLEKSITISY